MKPTTANSRTPDVASAEAGFQGGPDPATLRERALRLLARREHSRAELAQKLARAGFAPDAIAPVLDDLEARAWLSDRRFAESWVADHHARSGAIRLAHELRQRGVSDAIVREVLAQPRDTELDRARAVWQKKFGALPASPAEYAKQARYLAGRGFSADVARALLRPRDD